MRISDWSSDVCSYELVVQDYLANVGRDAETAKNAFEKGLRDSGLSGRWIETEVGTLEAIPSHARLADLLDRKSVVSGKSVSVLVDHGVRRFIKKHKRAIPYYQIAAN